MSFLSGYFPALPPTQRPGPVAAKPAKKQRAPYGMKLTLGDLTLSVSQWAKRLGLHRVAIYKRLERGWPMDRVLQEAHGKRHPAYELTYEGVTRSGYQWAKFLGISPGTLNWRIRQGWSVEEALTTDVHHSISATSQKKMAKIHGVEFNGKRKTLAAWARELGLSPDGVYWRLHHGWTLEEALTVGRNRRWLQKKEREAA